MSDHIRHRRTGLLAALLAVLLALGLLAGCGQQAAPAPVTAPVAPVTAPAVAPAPAPAPVDKMAIVKEAAVAYFNNLPADSNNIKAADVQKLIDGKSDAFFGVDIRRAEDYAKGHLPGFINLPFGDVGKNIDKLPKDKMIIFQCYSGQTASQTTAAIRMAGFNAKNLHFGFNGVTDAKLPLVQ